MALRSIGGAEAPGALVSLWARVGTTHHRYHLAIMAAPMDLVEPVRAPDVAGDVVVLCHPDGSPCLNDVRWDFERKAIAHLWVSHADDPDSQIMQQFILLASLLLLPLTTWRHLEALVVWLGAYEAGEDALCDSIAPLVPMRHKAGSRTIPFAISVRKFYTKLWKNEKVQARLDFYRVVIATGNLPAFAADQGAAYALRLVERDYKRFEAMSPMERNVWLLRTSEFQRWRQSIPASYRITRNGGDPAGVIFKLTKVKRKNTCSSWVADYVSSKGACGEYIIGVPRDGTVYLMDDATRDHVPAEELAELTITPIYV